MPILGSSNSEDDEANKDDDVKNINKWGYSFLIE